MKEFDIENFPTSESAKEMLHSVSEDFYQKSYVFKWILQAMGLEWDEAKKIIAEELAKQFFIETATWGLRYHEEKWQIPVREGLGYEERRKLLYAKRDFKAPMTPYAMEQYIEKALPGVKVQVMDCHDPGEFGFVPDHPNVFKVVFLAEGTLDVKTALQTIDWIKQSHTECLCPAEMVSFQNENREEIDICRICHGMECVEEASPEYHLSVAIPMEQEEEFDFSVTVKNNLHYFDGSLLWDGSVLMNSYIKKEEL